MGCCVRGLLLCALCGAYNRDEIVAEFIPTLSKASCDTGHHDAADALFGEGPSVGPAISQDQKARLKTFHFEIELPVEPDTAA